MTPEVSVFNLKLVGPEANPSHISFSTLPNQNYYTLPINHSAIVSRRPLRVMVYVPVGGNLYNLRSFEGKVITIFGTPEDIPILQSE